MMNWYEIEKNKNIKNGIKKIPHVKYDISMMIASLIKKYKDINEEINSAQELIVECSFFYVKMLIKTHLNCIF